MKLKKMNWARAIAMGTVSVGFVQALSAATTLTGLKATNADVPVDHGSNLAGTPNIALSWTTDPANNWDQYGNWPQDHGDGAYQVDGASDGSQTHTILFTPDSGWNVFISDFELNVWAGGGQTNVDWEVTGSKSGFLATGFFDIEDGFVVPVAISVTGTGSESLTLKLTQTSGRGSYLAMDNLTFDQIPAVPEPSSSALLGLGLGAMALRRKRKF